MAQTKSGKATGPAIISAVVGVVLGGALAIGAGAVATKSDLPTQEQIALTDDEAFLGSVQYGGRQH